MNFGFVTCVQLGKSCMEAIYEVGGKLSLAITLEDEQAVNKSGRVFIDDFCNMNNIPLIKSSNINNPDCIQAIIDYKIDWLFIIGWSQIAKIEVLSSAKKGVLGIHPTLLPEGRGRASIPWAILKKLPKTGVTLFKLDEGVDTGDILYQLSIHLDKNITATKLYDLVEQSHVSLIKKVIPLLEKDNVLLQKQDNNLATEWPGRKPSDGEINLKGSVYDAERLIRAVTKPYPGAFVNVKSKSYIIWEAKVFSSDSPEQFDNYEKIAFHDGILLLIDYEEMDS